MQGPNIIIRYKNCSILIDIGSYHSKFNGGSIDLFVTTGCTQCLPNASSKVVGKGSVNIHCCADTRAQSITIGNDSQMISVTDHRINMVCTGNALCGIEFYRADTVRTINDASVRFQEGCSFGEPGCST